MTILVTGATGFLGSHLAAALRADDEPVRALVRGTRGRRALEALGVEVAEGALEDVAAVRRAAEGARLVFHCAALVSDWAPQEAFVRANVVGVRNVVEACLGAGVERLVHVSTTDVYGHPDAPVDEEAPMLARGYGYGYGDTKLAGERVVWEAVRARGLAATVLRPASIYGPGSVPFVLEPAAMLRSGLMFRVAGPPKPLGLAYVSNVVDALRLAATHPGALGRAFNVHDGLRTSFNEYIERLADELGLRRPRLSLAHRHAYRLGQGCEALWGALRLPGRPPLTRLAVDLIGTHQGFGTDRLRRELGFAPAVGLDEGLARIGRATRAQGGERGR